MSKSDTLQIDPDDPRFTAYVLDELEPAERAEIDRLLAASPEARAAIEEIRETVTAFTSAYDSETASAFGRDEAVSVGVIRPGAEFSGLASTTRAPQQRLSRSAILSIAGTIAVASLLIAMMSSDQSSKPNASVSVNQGEQFALLYDQSNRANLGLSDMTIDGAGRPRGQMAVQNTISATEATVASQEQKLSELKFEQRPHIVRNGALQAAPTPVPTEQITVIESNGIAVADSAASNSDEGRSLSLNANGQIKTAQNGVPILNKLPHVARAKRDAKPQNGAAAAGTNLAASSPPASAPYRVDLQLGVTPRIIIKDETPSLVTNEFAGKEISPGQPADPALRAGYLWYGSQSNLFGRGSTPLAWSEWDLTEQGRAKAEAITRYYSAIAGRGEASRPERETYEPIVENNFLPPTAAPLSTFGVDVDTASYANVRRFLTQNQLPPANAVRIEELLNYFKYNDAPPQGDKPFSVGLEASACPWNLEHLLVRVGLKGKTIPKTERPASNLVFLVDVSGSMQPDNKLPLLKSGLELLVNELTENDRLAIVTYAGHAGVALESTTGNEKSKILGVIRSLNADGSTNGEGGLRLAYEQAVRNFIANGSNRVILCTDGDFNVGVSDDGELVKIIEEKATSGVYLSIFGFGMGNIKDAKLEKLADKGNGHYGYIDGIREAQKVFVEEMTGTLYTIAKDVKVQVEFNPARVGAYRLIGYENRVMTAEDFHNDAKDSGDIGAGHSVTALYEIIPIEKMPGKKVLKYQPTANAAPAAPNQSRELLTLSLRYKHPEMPKQAAPGLPSLAQESVQEDYPFAAPSDSAAKSSNDLRWASAVAAFGMILRNSPHKGNADLRMVTELASSSIGAADSQNSLPADVQYAEVVRRQEFLALVETTRKLRGEQSVEKSKEMLNLEEHYGENNKPTAVRKGMSEADVVRTLSAEGFVESREHAKAGWRSFRKPWMGGYQWVNFRVVDNQVVELGELWNDP